LDLGQTFPTLAEERKQAFDAYRETFPSEVAGTVARMPEAHWPVLHLVRKSAASRDLLPENPALALALAEAFVDPTKPDRPLGPFESLRQRHLAGAVGFPATDAAVRALRKIPPESASFAAVSHLRFALRNPAAAKLAAHLSELNTGVLAILCDPDLLKAAEPTLLAEVAGRKSERGQSPTAAKLAETLCYARQYEPDRTFRFHSIEQLRRIHTRMIATYIVPAHIFPKNAVFPRPPVPGIPGQIIPLRSVIELEREGLRQKNCVGSYAGRVLAGLEYIYRVEQPERATLSLVKGRGGAWSVAELRASCNRPVRPATIEAVDQWLSLCSFQRSSY
jgi:transcriptional regulator with XRE-family HTH domain